MTAPELLTGDIFAVNSSIVNVLDYAACAFPVTVADKTVDVMDAGYKPRSERDAYNIAMCTLWTLSCYR